jgi:hypothetical protein
MDGMHGGDTSAGTGTVDDVAIVGLPAPGVDAPAGGALRQVLAVRRGSVLAWIAGGLAAALMLFFLLPRPHADEVRPVDPTAAITAARQQPGFVVYASAQAPAGWHSDSALFHVVKGEAQLHIGYLAPDGGYAGLEETDARDSWRFVERMTAGGITEGVVRVGDSVWFHMLSDRKNQQSLVWYGPHSTVVLTGVTGLAGLTRFAASLNVGSQG